MVTYVRNNPPNTVDPDGRAVFTAAVVIGCVSNAACRGAVGAVIGGGVSAAFHVGQKILKGEDVESSEVSAELVRRVQGIQGVLLI